MSIKITHTDHTAKTTTTIECENIHTLREIGYISVIPKMSASAESNFFGKLKKHIDILKCQAYSDCLDCPQFCACNNIE